MKVLVTGMNGQLGSELQELAKTSKHKFVFADSATCNIIQLETIDALVQKENIDAIINCAAYTAVDNAEDDEKNAMKVNYVGVQNLNTVAEKHKIKLIHISTDYVFAGDKNTPYETNDPVSPIGVYGKSKRKGEEVIINSNADAIAIRTSWLYSSFGNNFVKTMLRLGEMRSDLTVVDDQIGSPTYARDLAAACIKILDANQFSGHQRIYHFANSGSISWCHFAQEIIRIAKLDCDVRPIPTSEYPTKAERPKYSVLSTRDIRAHFGVTVPQWDDSLKACISKITD